MYAQPKLYHYRENVVFLSLLHIMDGELFKRWMDQIHVSNGCTPLGLIERSPGRRPILTHHSSCRTLDITGLGILYNLRKLCLILLWWSMYVFVVPVASWDFSCQRTFPMGCLIWKTNHICPSVGDPQPSALRRWHCQTKKPGSEYCWPDSIILPGNKIFWQPCILWLLQDLQLERNPWQWLSTSANRGS